MSQQLFTRFLYIESLILEWENCWVNFCLLKSLLGEIFAPATSSRIRKIMMSHTTERLLQQVLGLVDELNEDCYHLIRYGIEI
jgi:hypothetical protein